MKLFLCIVAFSLSPAIACAQSLDIGGIELHLGQKADEALRSLSPYRVEFQGSTWIVSQKVGSSYQFLGTLSATNSAVTFISKLFDTNGNIDTPTAYTRASQELRRRGGAVCATREVEYSDRLIREFETQCGPYKLTYHMPSKAADGTPMLGGVGITLRKQ